MRHPSKPKPMQPSWEAFSAEQSSKTPVTARWLANNHVSITRPGNMSDEDTVRLICSSAQEPVPVVALSERLKDLSLPRGGIYLGPIGDFLDRIAFSHSGLTWWITDDGIYMREVPAQTTVFKLNRFDQIAGPLVVARWSTELKHLNTNLSDDSLRQIAAALDEARLRPAETLQPTVQKRLKVFNEGTFQTKINTFAKMASAPNFRDPFRKRLALARQRYVKALMTAAERPSKRIPTMFHSYPIV